MPCDSTHDRSSPAASSSSPPSLSPPISPPASAPETAHRPPPSSLPPFALSQPTHFGTRYNRVPSLTTHPRAEVPAISPPHSQPSSHSARTPGPSLAPQRTSPAHFAPGPTALRNASTEILSAPLPSAAEI